MIFSLDMVALLLLLPEVALLSTLPFAFYWIVRAGGAGSCALAAICVAIGLIVMAFYFVVAFGSGMSGGGAGTVLGNRLLQSPIQVVVSLIVFPIAGVGLAVAGKGTLGLWVFAMCTGFLSFWAGEGWLLAETEWWYSVGVAVVGGLCGLAAGLFLSRGSQQQQRSRKVLLWSAVGVIFTAAGMLASQLSPSRSRSLIATPSVDQLVMLNVLIIVAVVWLSLSTIAALITGYIGPNKPVPSGG